MEEPAGPGSTWRTRLGEQVGPVCDTCVTATEVDGGSVALRSSAGVRDVLHATDAIAHGLEQLQSGLDEGPCVDAVVDRSVVLVDDLAALLAADRALDPGGSGDPDPRRERSELLAERWSFFLPQAAELGVRSLFAFPLRVGSVALGSLELYRRDPGPLRAAQLHQALQAAHDLSRAVLEQVTTQGAAGRPYLDAGIGRAAATVHQAAGMVMVQIDGTIEEAMAQLRAAAFADGRALADLAFEVVRGQRRFGKGLR